MSLENLQIIEISSEKTIPVRQPVLRAGRPVADCIFDGDDLETTIHLGAFINNKLVGVVTYMKNANTLFDSENQYQLRGMAVLEDYQAKGVGKKLLYKGEQILKLKEAQLIWCNARIIALPFYKSDGFKIIGEEFHIPTVGPHFVMWKEVL